MKCFSVLKKSKRNSFYIESANTVQVNLNDISFKITDGLLGPYCCKVSLCNEPDYVRFIIDTGECNVNKTSRIICGTCESLDVIKERLFILVKNSKIGVKIQYNPLEVSVTRGEEVVCLWKVVKDVIKDGRLCFVSEMRGVCDMYGLTERASLSRLVYGQKYRLHNTDEFGLARGTDKPLYGSVPFVISVLRDHCLGILCNNESDTVVHLSTKRRIRRRISCQYWWHKFGSIDTICLPGNDGIHVRQSLLHITGITPLPPLFALGYHQCRWNYDDQQDVIKVDNGLREAGIPCDVLWLDIEHTDGKRYFTWDKDKFDPVGLVDYLKSNGRHLVVIVDPHIKQDPEYEIYQEALDRGYLVKNTDGSVFIGECWPGDSAWIDYMSDEASAWWSDKICGYLKKYSATNDRDNHLWIWNDMNEPSVFKCPDNQMDSAAVHANGVTHGQIHNIYGQQMAMATWKGILKASDGNLRPFLLSRSFYSGSQKYGAIWTGDTLCSWDHLRISVSMVLSLSICGIDFCGSDVGGFFGDPTPELLCRWYQLGAFQPFFRAHAHIESQRREPYLIDEPYRSAIKNAVHRRYELLAYWYLCFWQAETELLPVVAPIWMNFHQNHSMDDDSSFMIGRTVLVRPIVTALCLSISVVLPGTRHDLWYQYCQVSSHWQVHRAGQKLKIPVNIESIPIFYRGGHCIFTKEGQYSNTAEWQHAPYNILLFPNHSGTCSGLLYTDDYRTFAYKNNGGYNLHRCDLDLKQGSLSLDVLHAGHDLDSNVSTAIARITVIRNGLHTLTECGDCVVEQFNDRIEITNVKVTISGKWRLGLK